MADYLIEFEAHIDERKRPEQFPHSVFIREQYTNIENIEQLKGIYNDRFKTIVNNPGIAVFMDDEIIDSSKVRFDQRVYVPWHMITHFHGRTELIVPAAPKPPDLAKLTPADPPPEPKETVQ